MKTSRVLPVTAAHSSQTSQLRSQFSAEIAFLKRDSQKARLRIQIQMSKPFVSLLRLTLSKTGWLGSCMAASATSLSGASTVHQLLHVAAKCVLQHTMSHDLLGLHRLAVDVVGSTCQYVPAHVTGAVAQA